MIPLSFFPGLAHCLLPLIFCREDRIVPAFFPSFLIYHVLVCVVLSIPVVPWVLYASVVVVSTASVYHAICMQEKRDAFATPHARSVGQDAMW